jgi:hypothetical protein
MVKGNALGLRHFANASAMNSGPLSRRIDKTSGESNGALLRGVFLGVHGAQPGCKCAVCSSFYAS